MPTRFTVVCDDDHARRIATLARRHDLTEEAVLEQLIDLGLDSLDRDAGSQSAIEK